VRLLPALLLTVALPSPAQEHGSSHELLGQLGGRAAIMQLYETPRADGSARLTGEYLVLPSRQQRYVEGERSKQLGVTFLKEGNSPILYGRPATATLQGTWSAGVLKGTRYAPGGQERERFEFSEKFPDMSGYSAKLHCELEEGRYATRLAYEVENGRLKSFEWRSKVAPAGHPCSLAGLEQQPFAGGLRFASGACSVTLRDLGEGLSLRAENCSAFCGSEAYLEPMLIERDGACQLLRPQPR
jgi:hypothetical protein